jgi:hypothetical protein
MGLELTIYMAKRESNAGGVDPFMPDPPEGTRWVEVAGWRKFGSLTQALFPGHGSPDWKVMTAEDLDRVRGTMTDPAWVWPRFHDLHEITSQDMQDRFKAMLTHTLNVMRVHLLEGRTLLIEVVD